MISLKRRKHMLWFFTIFLAILSGSILMMPLASTFVARKFVFIYISGTMFWLGAVGTVYMMFEINRSGRKSLRFQEEMGDLKQLGLIHFFQNIEATIADVLMFAFFIGFVITVICTREILCSFILLATFIFAFGMHCILNGINYKYYKHLKNKLGERKDHELLKEENSEPYCGDVSCSDNDNCSTSNECICD